ncbi:class III lanthionine synthetase LanKC [Sinosporangium siamense]|uniref:Serine/threonine protein kinase n=1 Tax=Sinosporangium siamense TaxID=1367973 RepID=A0A919VA19_9ACTN|nr:class III lanthionine synthetase LanKC [Sinosporangium siamense]GII90664.1 serine/threonine protein kinase [Sinosporangium siamense]
MQHELMQIYTLADPLFFEDASLWRQGAGYIADGEFTVSSRPTPAGWTRAPRTVWQSMRPDDRPGPEQGWKIHVSATLENADRLCTAVWDYCVPRRIPFKHLLNRNMLLVFNAKYTPRGSGSKLITIYPADEEELSTTLRELSALTEGETGPYILSDLRYGGGPLYVRYGGFTEMRCVDESGETALAIRHPDGTLVPDRRKPYFDPPSWAPLPEVLRPHAEARKSRKAGQGPPYRVERALHFSNAGGVYVATRQTDGVTAVLKEARPHTALDNNHLDSQHRLKTESWALRKLEGIDGVPRWYDEFSVDDHMFLAEEFVEGEPLAVWIGTQHPWVVKAEATQDELADYTRKAVRLMDSLEALLGAIHERDVAFGDLHLGNVLVRPDGTAALVDFELAFDTSWTDWRPGLGATGFVGRGKTGVALDTHALEAVRLAVFLSFSKISVLQPSKVFQLVRVMTDNFPVPPGWAERILKELAPAGHAGAQAEEANPVDVHAPVVDWDAVGGSIAEGILSTATPERQDRLFPGDVQQFVSGGLSFAYGAAGVLWALDVTGHGRFPDHEKWLIEAVNRSRAPRPGFYDGVAGLAYTLDYLGHEDEAADLLERHPAPEHCGMTLFSGLAGIGAAHLHFGRRHGDGAHREKAIAIAERLAGAVREGRPHLRPERPPAPRSVEAGLMRGWSGVALFLIRLYEETSDTAYLDLALQAVHRDLDLCVVNSHGALMVEEANVRMMPYLEIGSAGIALVIDELAHYRDDDRMREALPRLLHACSGRLSVQSGLFRGKSGHITTLARMRQITYDRTTLDRHLRELSWHAIAFRGHVAFPGNLGFRLSMDLATGGAGVLLAVAAAASPGDIPFLPFFSPRTGQA